MDRAMLVPPLPGHVQLEVTAACNLRCQMCLVSYRPPLNKVTGTMTLETFTRVVDELPHPRRITLQGLGEPLLVPHLVDMVRHAVERGAEVGFNTNGMLLSRRRAEALIEAGLSWLHVSLDGARAATYEGIRGRSNFEQVLRNVRGLLTAKHRLGVDNPRVELVFVAMRKNVAELPALVRLAAELGVADVHVQNLSHSFADTDPAGDYAQIRAFASEQALWQGVDRLAETAFADARALAAELGIELRLPDLAEPSTPRVVGQPGCSWPWEAAYVRHDGAVQPCCMIMGGDRSTLGSVNDARFADVWVSEPYREFRSQLLGDTPPDVCRGCSLYRGVF